MDVYGESGKRAHGTGFVGIDADAEDAVDTIEVYEALVNPQESSSGGKKGGGGMMPPMMGGMGGAGGGGAASGGMSNAAAASNAAVGARAMPTGGSGAVLPGGTVPAAAPGVGSSPPAGGAGGGLGSGLGSGAGGGMGVPSHQPVGVMAAGAGDIGADGAVAPDGLGDTADTDGHDASATGTSPAADSPPDASMDDAVKDNAGEESRSVDGDGRVLPDTVRTDVVTVDPVEIDRVAREWSSLSESMAGLSTNISTLEAAKGDFGMVDMPEAGYGTMTAGLRRVTGGASEEFGQISQGLSATTRNVRENEESAAAVAEGITK